jgi:hypothetical protein
MSDAPMSHAGQKQTCALKLQCPLYPPKADIAERDWDVR